MLSYHQTTALLAVSAILSFAGSIVHGQEVEHGQAKFQPWSGYWWPHRKGELLGPLRKYDQLTGKKSVAEETRNHPVAANTPSWFGYCHASAASSIMEPQPTRPHQAVSPAGRKIELNVGDQKGLLAACHARDIANSYGDRFGDDRGSEDPQDLSPDRVWWLLKLYVKRQGVPLILDIEAGPQVWNYPVYAYSINYQLANSGEDLYNASMTLWMADNGVAPDFVGMKVRRHMYFFQCIMRNNAIEMGSAKWIGQSVKDHPDFAWFPFVARPENSEVSYELVQEILNRDDSETVEPPATDPSEESNGPREDETPNELRPVGLPRGVAALSPTELAALVLNRTSSFGVDVTVDRFDGGHYQPGERYRLRGSSAKDGFLYLLHVDPRGSLRVLYPLPGQNNAVKASSTFRIRGPRKDQKGFVASNRIGVHRVKAIVTSRPLLLSGLIVDQRADENQSQIGAEFRWHPTGRQQIQQLLRQGQAQQASEDKDQPAIDLNMLLGEFGQDEVAFFVRKQDSKEEKR